MLHNAMRVGFLCGHWTREGAIREGTNLSYCGLLRSYALHSQTLTHSTGSPRMIGLGCMRLSTAADRDDERAVSVIRAALDAGATLLDTADAYCRDDREAGHNERLIARALAGWGGDRARITVATKGGMRRPNRAWVADGRAKHLRDACDASRRALAVETIDLYQLHAVDPRTPLETSVRALARLQTDGKIRDLGLFNVTVSQIQAARSIVAIDRKST